MDNKSELMTCPLILAKPLEECYGLQSNCWVAGGPDIDCPADEICCFDGCVQVCHKGELSDPDVSYIESHK